MSAPLCFGEGFMDEIKHAAPDALPQKHKREHPDYEYYRRDFVPREGHGCKVSIYELPPGKSAYPYHYHTKNEEVFYILSGTGTLKTPAGDRAVSAGEFLFFPATAAGAHKLTNASETEPLVYIDFDTANDLDAAVYPDSGKIGIWGKGVNRVFRLEDAVEYYEGE